MKITDLIWVLPARLSNTYNRHGWEQDIDRENEEENMYSLLNIHSGYPSATFRYQRNSNFLMSTGKDFTLTSKTTTFVLKDHLEWTLQPAFASVRNPSTKCVLPLASLKKYTIDGKEYLTQFATEFISHIGDVIDLEEIVGNNLTFNLHTEIANTDKYNAGPSTLLHSLSGWVDSVGSLAILNEEQANLFNAKYENSKVKIKCVKTKSLFKGNTPHFTFDTQPITNLSSGGRFFLYTTKLEVLTEEGIELVPFIGLATFAGAKLLKYKNSISLATALLKNTSVETTEYLNPERYSLKNKYKKHAFELAYPGISKFVPKENYKSVSPTIVAPDQIPNEANEKFRGFFVSQAVARRAEGIEFFKLVNKKKQLEVNREAAEEEFRTDSDAIRLEENNMASYATEIARLTRMVENLQASIEQMNKRLPIRQAKIDEVKNLISTLDTSLAPLREQYAALVKKEFESENPIDTIAAWKKAGFHISELKLRNFSNETGASNAEEIRDIFLRGEIDQWYISKLTICTSKPTIIYKDAHKIERARAERYVAGPWKLYLTFDRSSVYLYAKPLDDRSVRAVYDAGYGELRCRVHPHFGEARIASTILQANPRVAWSTFNQFDYRACLGELEPILAKAMRGADLKSIMYGLQAYLETADSHDTWGSTIQYFPKLSDVDLSSWNDEVVSVDVERIAFDETIFVKKEKEKYNFAIFLKAGNKVDMILTTNVVENGSFVLTVKDRESLYFESKTLADTFLQESEENLKKDAYVLLASNVDVESCTLNFPISMIESSFPEASVNANPIANNEVPMSFTEEQANPEPDILVVEGTETFRMVTPVQLAPEMPLRDEQTYRPAHRRTIADFRYVAI